MASTDGDILPSYNTLFPEDEPVANNINERRRRFTTITLREIYYPSGCPCHPKEKKSDKKGKRKQQEQTHPNQFPFQQSEQRQLHLKQQYLRRFEILKDTAVGLGLPQNLHPAVVEVSMTMAQLSRPPQPVTSIMKW
ncbi:hypothetical protein H2202_004687 [Exophiala xenobiotica]|nr:hypothetical protein H2202_004687 [Exophiala xenobiotica]